MRYIYFTSLLMLAFNACADKAQGPYLYDAQLSSGVDVQVISEKKHEPGETIRITLDPDSLSEESDGENTYPAVILRRKAIQ